MEIPIYIDGEETGRLTIGKQAAWLVLQAKLRPTGRVVRLNIYGDGEPFYLGVPTPEAGELCLTRHLTPTEARRLPENPSYAAETPLEDALPRHVLRFGGRVYYF